VDSGGYVYMNLEVSTETLLEVGRKIIQIKVLHSKGKYLIVIGNKHLVDS
jgi:hypothetical protein